MSSSSSNTDIVAEIRKLLSKPARTAELFDMVVNVPFQDKLHTTSIDLGIVVLLLVNKKEDTIDRVSLSKTEHADWAVKMTPIPFHDIKIPLNNKQNIIAKAIKTGEAQKTTDWKYLFTPALAPEAARFNQAGAGIACSFVYPLPDAQKGEGGAMIFSFYQPLDHITKRHISFMEKYSGLVNEVL